MDRNSRIERQTAEILRCLFSDEHDAACRQLDCRLETDGPDGPDDDIDPVLIADKLRTVADSLVDNAEFQAALRDFKQVAAQQAVDKAFTSSVEALSQARRFQTTEVASEVQLMNISVAFGLYVIKTCPELKTKVQGVMSAFVNRAVKQRGGWDKV